jgi:ABC-type dipeptide/oligopeptide/nickel transport system permease component
MLNYIIRRLLLMFPTLIGMTAVVFFTMAYAPGGVGASLRSKEAEMRPQERKAMEEYYNKRYGLNLPPPVQYVRWLGRITPIGPKEAGEGFPRGWKVGIKAPDLGESMSRHRPVGGMILEAVPVTLMLNLIVIPLIYISAINIGIHAAKNRGELLDVGSGTVLLGLWSIPTIWTGVLLIGFFANTQYLHLFPTNGLHDIQSEYMTFLPSMGAGGFERGWLLDALWHMVLPIACMSYGGLAVLSKMSRSSVLEVINLDFVRTARAKGLTEKVILYRHVLRNSLLPLITMAASLLPGLIAGSLVVEYIFGLPGMGRLSWEAVNARDRELILATTLIAGLLGLTGTLLSDICNAIADPRVSYE